MPLRSNRSPDRFPWSEAELVGILAPGAGKTALRDDGPKCGFGQHIHPRRRRHLPVRGGNNILAPIRSESAQSVVERQIVAWLRGDRQGFGTMVRVGVRRGTVTSTGVRPLIWSPAPPGHRDDSAGNRLEQDAVLLRYLVRRSHENAAGSIVTLASVPAAMNPMIWSWRAAGNRRDLRSDHQIHRQSF